MTDPSHIQSLEHAAGAGTGDALVGTLASFTDGFWHNLWFGKPASTKNGEASDWMNMWLWWFCVAWFVVLMAIMFFFVVRYRRSKVGPVAKASSAHNTPIELAWTIIPSLFLVFMFFKGFWGYIDNVVAPSNATEIRVEAAKWSWRFIYPTGAETRSAKQVGSISQPVFYVPAGKPVQLRMKSKDGDVMHALWIPDFRIKADVLPNRYTTLWFETKPLESTTLLSESNEPLVSDKKFAFLKGVPFEDHWLFCAEYCGDNHSEMAATVRVVPEAIYKKWLAAVSDPSDLAPAAYGEILYKSQCASCHSVTPGAVSTGPNWTELWGNPSIPIKDQPPAKGDADYVRESVRNPAAKIHDGFPNNMTPFPASALSDEKLEALFAFMKRVSKFTSQEEKDEVMRVVPKADKPEAPK
jgi:cytochrome c oxidase subunit II